MRLSAANSGGGLPSPRTAMPGSKSLVPHNAQNGTESHLDYAVHKPDDMYIVELEEVVDTMIEN
jgi:hypothetical protein